jgi:hypothetical protein
MRSLLSIPFVAILLAACTGSAGGGPEQKGDRCLYAVEAEFGNQLQWGSCSHPPPYARRVE